jgi:hypothetical protein
LFPNKISTERGMLPFIKLLTILHYILHIIITRGKSKKI